MQGPYICEHCHGKVFTHGHSCPGQRAAEIAWQQKLNIMLQQQTNINITFNGKGSGPPGLGGQ